MKKILFVFLWFGWGRLHAQVEEVTQADDNARQLQYYLQQLAANAVMIKYMRDGMNIARFGLHTIYTIKNKEFNLHDLFFKSLRAINPKIKELGTVAEIIDKEAQILQIYRSTLKRIKESGQFTEQEFSSIITVFHKMLDDTAGNLDELLKVMTPNYYNLSDDERITRINQLHTDMNSCYDFVQQFSHEVLILAMQRLQEKKDAGKSKILLISNDD